MNDAGRSVFITGAASGIGLAAARRFAGGGWFVGLADMDEAGLAAARAAIGAERCLALPLDVRDRAAWERALAAFGAASGGRLDALVNNAGFARFGWLEELAADDLERIVAVNLMGVVNGARAALPLLKATGGRLINVASCAGLYGVPRLAVYSATKFAVKGLSEALELEFARHGVAVRCLLPWFIETPMLDSAVPGSQPIRSMLAGVPIYPADEAAEAVWTAAHSGRLHIPVGARAKSLLFAVRLLPAAVRKQLRALMAA